jgi:hypothetical protein
VSTKRIGIAVFVATAAVILAAVGRSESATDVKATNARIRATFDLVSGDLGARLNAYRPTPMFGCFLYRFGPRNPYGVEICVDERGDVVETIDRRNGAEHISSLRYEPSKATTHVDISQLVGILHRRDPRQYPATLPLLPLSSADLGPIVLPKAGASPSR